jgi:hypothetical protein
MNDANPSAKSAPKRDAVPACSSASPPQSEQAAPAPDTAIPKKLTAEEQMALYEKQLKEDDWGHQPC